LKCCNHILTHVDREKMHRLSSQITKAKYSLAAAWSGAIENRDYGHLHILNEYCEMPLGYPIFGRLQHGWFGHMSSENYYKNNIHPTFVWTRNAEKAARTLGWNNFYAIGAPWLYLLELNKRWGNTATNAPESERNIDELWVFSLHSTSMSNDYGVDENDIHDFILTVSKSLAKSKIILLAEFDFYKYLELDIDVPSDIRIISLGQRRDTTSANAHLHKLFLLLANTKKVLVDYPTTLLFYALTLECEVLWIKNKSYDLTLHLAKEQKQEFLVQLMSESVLTYHSHFETAMLHLGADQVKSPSELRRLFGWNSSNLIPMRRLISSIRSLSKFFRDVLKFLIV